MRETADVAIVGYGPVGAALAILLGQRGWRVRVLQAAGVADALTGHTEPGAIYEWRNARGETLLRIGREHASISGFPESNMFHQPELESILDARVHALTNVSVRRGCEVTQVWDDGAHAHVVASGPDGDGLEVEARYAVGCDGAQSFVRGALGAGWHDLGFHFDWLVVDVRFVRRLDRTITLAELKAHADDLDDFMLVRRGNRLSVMPVTDAQWTAILALEHES